MMVFGIYGMIGKWIVNLLLHSTIDTNDWMGVRYMGRCDNLWSDKEAR